MEFELPKLPYNYDALEPYIDEQTMIIHHTKHHQAYLDKLNNAIKTNESFFEGKTIEEILKNLDSVPTELRETIRNNGGGHYNHSLFWKIMTPKKQEVPSKLKESINNSFGSFETFKEKFSNAAITRFGSGWAWLVVSNNNLEILSTPNQDTPLSLGKTPILGIDVWEHAYYLKYQNRRPEYVNNFFNIINWEEVEKNYLHAKKENP